METINLSCQISWFIWFVCLMLLCLSVHLFVRLSPCLTVRVFLRNFSQTTLITFFRFFCVITISSKTCGGSISENS